MTRRSPEELLRELGRAPIPVEDEEVVSERRQRVVSRIATSLRKGPGEARARRWRRALGWAAVAATLLALIGAGMRARHVSGPALGVASLRTSSSPVMLSQGGKTEVATPNSVRALGLGDGVSTLADSHAEISLASGAEVSIRPSTRIELAEADARAEVVFVALGEIAVRVPRLGPERSFSVKTPDARLVVHGTQFVVRVEAVASGTFTRVEVTEGKVSVERGAERAMLERGDAWPSQKLTSAKPAKPDAPKNVSATTETPASKPSSRLAKAPTPSDLAEQNRLFAAATSARRRGDDRAAVSALTQLINRYPKSVLVPEARVERFRALKRLGRDAEAEGEARKYLVEQRDGAARDEARGVALEPKP